MSLTTVFLMKEEVLIVRLSGELDHHEAGILRTAWQKELHANDVKHIILNLKEVSFMDSSGIGVVLGRYKEITAFGGVLAMCSVNPSLKRIFEMSGLFKIIRLEENEQLALDSLGVTL